MTLYLYNYIIVQNLYLYNYSVQWFVFFRVSFVAFVNLIRGTHETKYERTIHESNERTIHETYLINAFVLLFTLRTTKQEIIYMCNIYIYVKKRLWQFHLWNTCKKNEPLHERSAGKRKTINERTIKENKTNEKPKRYEIFVNLSDPEYVNTTTIPPKININYRNHLHV
jgi:hypothetical protein